MSSRADLNRDKKKQIAMYAASLITDEDLVYLDAGTTTGFIVDYLSSKNTVFVTNAIVHARKLCSMGYQVYMPGGMLKERTEALAGTQTCEYLTRFHFTKGFFGTNGIHPQAKFTTPDPQECAIKAAAINKCFTSYILADHTKFDRISTATFSDFTRPIIITEKIDEKYKSLVKMISVDIPADLED